METLLGSAAWGKWETSYERDVFLGNRLVLGSPEYGGDRWFLTYVKNHLLTIGGTRGGKGTGQIIPNLLAWGGSCVVIDPKGENAWITAQARREKGQKVFILDPWGEVNRRYGEKAGELETVAGFNPLSILDPQSLHYADDVAYLADALILSQGSDPHWSDSGRELVAGLIAFLAEKYGQVATLGALRLLITKGAIGISKVAEEAEAFGEASLAYRKLARFVEINKENSSIISTVLTQTAFLDSGELAKSLSQSDFSFDALVQERATIYLVLPVDKLMTYGRWLRLMLSIAIRTVARNTRKLALPVLFMLDEFGTIGKLSAIAQAFGLMAGLQMCVWAFLQDLNQLKRDYPDDWETFIANAQAVTIFGLADLTTCRYFSDMMGNQTIITQSEDAVKKGKLPGQRMDDQFHSRALATSDELRRHDSKKGIIIGRFQPTFFTLAQYFKSPAFLSKCRPDPNYPEMLEKVEAAKDSKARERDLELRERFPNWKKAKEELERLGFKVEVIKEGGFLLKNHFFKVEKDGKAAEFSGKILFYAWAIDIFKTLCK